MLLVLRRRYEFPVACHQVAPEIELPTLGQRYRGQELLVHALCLGLKRRDWKGCRCALLDDGAAAARLLLPLLLIDSGLAHEKRATADQRNREAEELLLLLLLHCWLGAVRSSIGPGRGEKQRSRGASNLLAGQGEELLATSWAQPGVGHDHELGAARRGARSGGGRGHELSAERCAWMRQGRPGSERGQEVCLDLGAAR